MRRNTSTMLQMDISLREIMKLLFKSWKSGLWKSLNILYLQTDLWDSWRAGEVEIGLRFRLLGAGLAGLAGVRLVGRRAGRGEFRGTVRGPPKRLRRL